MLVPRQIAPLAAAAALLLAPAASAFSVPSAFSRSASAPSRPARGPPFPSSAGVVVAFLSDSDSDAAGGAGASSSPDAGMVSESSAPAPSPAPAPPAAKEPEGPDYPLNVPSPILLAGSMVLAIASVGSIFELSGGDPANGFGPTAAIAAVGLPLCLFLFYAAIKKGMAETEEDDRAFLNK